MQPNNKVNWKGPLEALVKFKVLFKTLLAFDAIRPANKTRSDVLRQLMNLYIKTKGTYFGIGQRIYHEEEDKVFKQLKDIISYPIESMIRSEIAMHVRTIQTKMDEVMTTKRRVHKINPKSIKMLEELEGE